MTEVTEREIRPAELFQACLDLSDIDTDTYFAESPRTWLNCPACDDPGAKAFDKCGFAYRECPVCQSLWVGPRPPYESFSKFYADSPSSRYWAEVFYPTVEGVRRAKLWRPQARQVADIARDQAMTFRNVVDIGGGTEGFAEEYRNLNDCSVLVIESSLQSGRALNLYEFRTLRARARSPIPAGSSRGAQVQLT